MPVKFFRVQSPLVSLGILFLGAFFDRKRKLQPLPLLTRVRKLKLALGPSLVLVALFVGLCQAGRAQDYDLTAPDTEWREVPVSGGVTLFQNVRIFDGKSPALSTPSNVLVKGNTIERISASPITVDTNTDVRVIAAEGRVLMPGLIDAHWHAFMAATPQLLLMTADPHTFICWLRDRLKRL